MKALQNSKHKKTFKTALLLGALGVGAINLTACVPLVVVGTPAVVMGSNSISSNQSFETQKHDFGIKMSIMGIVNNSKILKNKSNIEAAVFNNIVLLIGQVPSKSER